MALTFRVLDSAWFADGQEFPAGEHTIEKPDGALVRLAGSGHAAGVIDVTDGLDTSHVQSQEESEEALRVAMGEHVVENLPDGTRRSYWTGPWYDGNVRQGLLDEARRELAKAENALAAAQADDPDGDHADLEAARGLAAERVNDAETEVVA